MALTDLGNLYISQSYQKVVQTEGGTFADGVGNPLSIVTTSQLSSATVLSASFATTSSYALYAETVGSVVSASYALNANTAVTASYIGDIDGGTF